MVDVDDFELVELLLAAADGTPDETAARLADLAALIGASAGLAVLGIAIETGLLRRIYRAPHEYQLLLTFALVFILGDAAKLIWGREDNSVAVPTLLAGSSHRIILPLSLLFGGAFLVLTDLLARTVASPAEIPIGVVTAFFGAPFFVLVLRRSKR